MLFIPLAKFGRDGVVGQICKSCYNSNRSLENTSIYTYTINLLSIYQKKKESTTATATEEEEEEEEGKLKNDLKPDINNLSLKYCKIFEHWMQHLAADHVLKCLFFFSYSIFSLFIL